MKDDILLPDGSTIHLPVKCDLPVQEVEEPHPNEATGANGDVGDKGFGLLEKARTGAGSTAAAGSDFFHIYRKQRAREMARLEKLEEEGQEEEFDRAYHAHREQRIREALNKTARKAEKRKRNQAAKRARQSIGSMKAD